MPSGGRYLGNFQKRQPQTHLRNMPIQFYQLCEGLIKEEPSELVHNYVQIVTGIYSRACGLSLAKK